MRHHQLRSLVDPARRLRRSSSQPATESNAPSTCLRPWLDRPERDPVDWPADHTLTTIKRLRLQWLLAPQGSGLACHHISWRAEVRLIPTSSSSSSPSRLEATNLRRTVFGGLFFNSLRLRLRLRPETTHRWKSGLSRRATWPPLDCCSKVASGSKI